MTIPTVSVGLPVYNGEKYLPSTLTRLLGQELEDFELIISDNASTDATEEICRAFAAKDTRIRYSRNPINVGLAANHNCAFRPARGPFFKWVSHDDDFPPRMLLRLVEVMRESPAEVSMVYARCEYVDGDGNVEGIDSDGVGCSNPWPHLRLTHYLRNVHMFNCPYGLNRTEMMRGTRLHGSFPGSDWVLFAEVAMLGMIVEIPEPLLRIRRHADRTFTRTRDPKVLREMFTPGKGHRFSPFSIRTRMELELIQSAMQVPVGLHSRVLCTAVAMAEPQWLTFRAFGGRQKRKLRQMLQPKVVL